jgi:hypothetical protein
MVEGRKNCIGEGRKQIGESREQRADSRGKQGKEQTADSK